MMKAIKILMALGMVGVIFYFVHVFLGQLLWQAYNPITTDISTLTADGSPNVSLLRVLAMIYGICTVLFAGGMVITAFKKNHTLLRIGFVIFFVMELTSAFGYTLFPLSADKTQLNFQNTMHIVVTAVVVITTIASGFFIALGYLRQERMKKLGTFVLIMAILITIFGALNPVGMTFNILGLTERLCIFTLQIMTFVLSLVYTFKIKERVSISI